MSNVDVYGIRNAEEFRHKYNKIISQPCFLQVNLSRSFYDSLGLEKNNYINSVDLFPGLEDYYNLKLYVFRIYNQMFALCSGMVVMLSINPGMVLEKSDDPIEVK